MPQSFWFSLTLLLQFLPLVSSHLYSCFNLFTSVSSVSQFSFSFTFYFSDASVSFTFSLYPPPPHIIISPSSLLSTFPSQCTACLHNMGYTCKSFTILYRLSQNAASPPLFSICYPYRLWSHYELPLSLAFLFSPFSLPYLLLWFLLALRCVLHRPSLVCASSSLSTNFVSCRPLIPPISPRFLSLF